MPFHFIDSNGQVDLDQFIIDSLAKPLDKEVVPKEKQAESWSILKPYQAHLSLEEVNRQSHNRPFQEKKQAFKTPQVAISPHLTVAAIMTRSVERLAPEHNLKAAFELFERYSFRHIPIATYGGQLMGMISDRDIIKWLYQQASSDWAAFYETPLRQVMMSPVLTVTEDTRVQEVADLMATHNIGSLPVVQQQCYNEEPILQGIVTKTDLYQLLIDAESLFSNE